MARVTVEDCIEELPNRFELILIAAQRARMIREGAPLTVMRNNDKGAVVALREVAEASIDPKAVKEALITNLQSISPSVDEVREADRKALKAVPVATEEAVMQAYQAEIDSDRDKRLTRPVQKGSQSKTSKVSHGR